MLWLKKLAVCYFQFQTVIQINSFCSTHLFETVPFCWCSILFNSSEAKTIPLSVWLSWEETQSDMNKAPVSECGDYFGNYLRRKFPKVDWHFQNVTSRFTFSTIDEDKESLLEELSVGAPPGATLQKSSLWAGTFWRVPQRHSRQRAHSYNTWPRNVETSHYFCGWNLADYANDDLIVNRWHSSSLCS